VRRLRLKTVLALTAAALALTAFPALLTAGPETRPPGELEPGAVAESGTAAEPGGAGEPAPVLDINAPSGILMDAVSGEVIFEKAADERHHPASLTKIMTLLLAVEALKEGRLKPADTIIASEHAVSHGGTQIWLEVGEEMALDQILLAIAVGSANDASVALAECMAGTEEQFAVLMNERARELGMTGTNFVNAHGLDHPDHYTTARDMALLSREAVRHPELVALTSIYEVHIRGEQTWLVNRNKMINYYQGCDGLKTGWTEKAGYSVSITAERGGSRFIAVVMGAPSPTDRFTDTAKMLNYAFARFASVALTEKDRSYGTVAVGLGACREVEAVAPDDYGVLVDKGTEGEVEREVLLHSIVEAPVAKGDVIGEIVARRGGEELGRWPLVAARDVDRCSYLTLLWRLFGRVLGGG